MNKRPLQHSFCILVLGISIMESGHALEGQIEFGLGVADKDEFLYSPFPGIDRSPFLVLNADLEGNSDEAIWRVTARDLGIDTRTFIVDYENDAGFSLFGEYWQNPSRQNGTLSSPFVNIGSTELKLPAGWVAGDETGDMTNLQTSLRQFNIGTERRRYTLGGESIFGQGMTFKAEAVYETKDGIELIGGAIGRGFGLENPPYGVGTRATLMPVPIDYQTTQLDLKLGYQKPRYGVELGYYLSVFRNGNDSLSWENPFNLDITGGSGHGGQFPLASSVGRLSLYPDNQFHRLSLSGNYLMGETTRFYGMFSTGMMRQDQAFLPLSANPTLATAPLLPVNDLDADASVNDAYLRVTSRPMPKLSLKAAYRYHSRDDNDRLLGAYNYYALDSSESGREIISTPYYYRKQEIDLSARYRFGSHTSFGLEYEREDILRDYVDIEREDVDEDRFSAHVDYRPLDNLSLRIQGEHAERSGSNYVTAIGENPLLRKFHFADRAQDGIYIRATYDLNDSVSLSASYDRLEDDYDNSVVGLQSADRDIYSFDIAYQFNENLSFHGFVSREEAASQQTGSTDGVNVTWTADYEDTIDSFGMGVEWQAIPERLKLSLDLALSDGSEAVTLSSLTPPVAQYPDLTSDMLSIRLAATYQYDKQTDIRLTYWHERLDTTDWALDDLDVNSTPNVILTGEQSPNYDDHIVMLSLVRHF
ncbi:MAG: MtrB/PioB family decaheme-associated outer membrane protein [Sedimenticolaceae bacterium]|nr:MtrB/PioB family decaheme-associated outer membrane protein [Sedimenticolaceae bacterium]